jgi:hypothetical protein
MVSVQGADGIDRSLNTKQQALGRMCGDASGSHLTSWEPAPRNPIVGKVTAHTMATYWISRRCTPWDSQEFGLNNKISPYLR